MPGASQWHAEDVSSSSDTSVGPIVLGYHDFSAGMLSLSQPGLALIGRVEARLLYDLYSVDGGVKTSTKQTKLTLWPGIRPYKQSMTADVIFYF